MKKEKILRAIGDIDDSLIDEAGADILPRAVNQKSSFKLWMKLASAAACLCVVAVGVILLTRPGMGSQWPVKELPRQTDAGSEIALVKKWGEMTVSEQFPAITVAGTAYETQIAVIPAEQVGALLGSAALTGFDVYTDTTYTANAVAYQINGISKDCAIAVCFEGQAAFYAYINVGYKPQTLGQFINDLRLHDTVAFGSVWYNWKKPTGEYATVEFTGLDRAVVFDMLLSDTSLPAVADYDTYTFVSVMSVSVDIPLLGYKNISLSVTEDGYLITNILATGKAFRIGEERVQAFIDYVKEHCEGHEIVWVDDGVMSPE